MGDREMVKGTHIQFADKNSSRNDGAVVAVNGETITVMRWIGPTQRFHPSTISIQSWPVDRTKMWLTRVVGPLTGNKAAQFAAVAA
jgi:hypothetical protein